MFFLGRNCLVALIVAIPASAVTAVAQTAGAIAVESRTYAGAADPWARSEPTFRARLSHRLFVDAGYLAFATSLRIDPTNAERNRIDIDELVWFRRAAAVDIAVGFREIFWGVLESANRVDVINQRDTDGRWPLQEKLGQPMIALTWMPAGTVVDVYLLPWARPRPFRGRRGRLWSNVPVDESASVYDVGPVARHLSWAVRWALTRSAWDVGLSYFGGTARDPAFTAALRPEEGPHLAPVYDRVHQFGLDVQYTGASWLWKLEVMTVDPSTGRYLALGSGVEYVAADYLSLFAEFLFDSRGEEATTSLERDVFLGARLLHRDGTVTGGVTVDAGTGNVIASGEFVHRIGNDLSVSLGLRGFVGRAGREPRHALREETSVSVMLRRHF